MTRMSLPQQPKGVRLSELLQRFWRTYRAGRLQTRVDKMDAGFQVKADLWTEASEGVAMLSAHATGPRVEDVEEQAMRRAISFLHPEWLLPAAPPAPKPENGATS